MLEELISNRDGLIVLACIIGIFYCVFDITLKIGQMTMRRKVERDVKKYTDRLPENTFETIEVQPEKPREETEEEQLDRMLNLGKLDPPQFDRPEPTSHKLKINPPTQRGLKYNSPIQQVKDLMKPRQIKPEVKSGKNGGLESF